MSRRFEMEQYEARKTAIDRLCHDLYYNEVKYVKDLYLNDWEDKSYEHFVSEIENHALYDFWILSLDGIYDEDSMRELFILIGGYDEEDEEEAEEIEMAPESPDYTDVSVMEIFDREGKKYYIDDKCILYNMSDNSRFIGRYILTNVSDPGDIMLRQLGQYAHIYSYYDTDERYYSCNLEYSISNRDYACLHADVVIVFGGPLEFGRMPTALAPAE